MPKGLAKIPGALGLFESYDDASDDSILHSTP